MEAEGLGGGREERRHVKPICKILQKITISQFIILGVQNHLKLLRSRERKRDIQGDIYVDIYKYVYR